MAGTMHGLTDSAAVAGGDEDDGAEGADVPLQCSQLLSDPVVRL